MACDDRQLTEAQRQAGYANQRTGVQRAVRPFTGSPTVENLIDYINRELQPAVKATRDAVNDVYLPVVDNAPSANPLGFYFSTLTAAADPTAGRVRGNASPQNTITTLRVSEDNARLQDVLPWLEVMAGGVTEPLGVITLFDAVNPSRFLRFDLDTMTDQGTYWDMGVTLVEASHDDPFVDGGSVVISFIPGIADNEGTGAQIPPGSITPIASDTFLGNISGSPASPSAVPLASVDSTSITYNGTAHEFQRAALTGFAAAAANTNATTSAEPIVTYSASANMSAERVTTSSTTVTVSTSVASQIEFQRAALTGAVAATANSNATLFAGIRDNGSAETDRTNLNFVSSTSNTAVVTDDAANDELEVTYQRAALTGFAEASANSNATTSAEPIITFSASSNMSNERVATSSTSVTVSTSVASQIEFQRAALTGFAEAAANSNATTSAEPIITYSASANMSAERVLSNGTNTVVDLGTAGQAQIDVDDFPLSGLADMAAGTAIGRQIDAGTGAPVALTGGEIAEIIRFANVTTEAVGGTFTDHALDTLTDVWNFTATSTVTGVAGGTAGRHLFIFNGAAAGSGVTVTINQFSGSSASGNRFLNPDSADLLLQPGSGALYVYVSSRWRCFSATGTVAAVRDGDKGDITVSASGATWTIDTNINKAWTGNHSFTSATFNVTTTGDTLVQATSGIGLFAAHTAADVAAGDLVLNATGGIAINTNTTTPVTTITNGNIEMDAYNRWIARGAIAQIEATADIWVSTTAGGIDISTLTAGHPVGVTNGAILLNAQGAIVASATTSFAVNTNGTERLEIENDGAWQVGGATGTSGHPLLSAGSAAPPAWGQLGSTGIADAAVTLAKQANLAQSTIIGRAEGAGTGVPQALTPTQVVSIIDGESPTWSASHRFDSYIQFGTSTGLPSSGDIRKAGSIRVESGGSVTLAPTDTLSLLGAVSMAGALTVSTSGSIDNLTIGNVSVVRFTNATDVTGMIAVTAWQLVWLLNASSNTINLHRESGSSSASNRWAGTGGSSLIIRPGEMQAAVYDLTSSRWRSLSGVT